LFYQPKCYRVRQGRRLSRRWTVGGAGGVVQGWSEGPIVWETGGAVDGAETGGARRKKGSRHALTCDPSCVRGKPFCQSTNKFYLFHHLTMSPLSMNKPLNAGEALKLLPASLNMRLHWYGSSSTPMSLFSILTTSLMLGHHHEHEPLHGLTSQTLGR
jgi:hypothetical protein